ncbi:hypothetical protein [Paraburkholderia sp. J8-2]|uniref:hypothetical protein n=1 Tax=Paraburkholderia sp. J8-2 TaxID=2805440 RepID=UPI002AB680BD|nr:hypothetical protein [Paraburkholderia sp. J8-2]
MKDATPEEVAQWGEFSGKAMAALYDANPQMTHAQAFASLAFALWLELNRTRAA